MATKKKGTGLLMVWCDVPVDKEPEFNRWYNEEHLAERMAVPGFLSAAPRETVTGPPQHLGHPPVPHALRVRTPEGVRKRGVEGPAERLPGEQPHPPPHEARPRFAGGVCENVRAVKRRGASPGFAHKAGSPPVVFGRR